MSVEDQSPESAVWQRIDDLPAHVEHLESLLLSEADIAELETLVAAAEGASGSGAEASEPALA